MEGGDKRGRLAGPFVDIEARIGVNEYIARGIAGVTAVL